MNERMKKLRAVTNKINGLAGFVKDTGKDNTRFTYNVIGGLCFAEGVMSKPEISIADMFIEKGAIFPKHVHEVNEWCIVYSGKLQIHYGGGDTKIIEISESMFFPSGQPHQITAIEDTRCVCIVVPSTGGFPNAR